MHKPRRRLACWEKMKAAIVIERNGNNPCASYHLYDKVFGRIDSADLGLSKSKSVWVAEITGLSKAFKFERRFLKYQRDYSDSNGSGSRGIFDTFILETERVYEVNDSGFRYFCKVSGPGDIVKIKEKEVVEWLKNASE